MEGTLAALELLDAELDESSALQKCDTTSWTTDHLTIFPDA